MAGIEDGIAQTLAYAADNSHGYELQCRRYGIGTDCAGLMILYAAAVEGVPLEQYPNFHTWTEVATLTARGWKDIPFSEGAKKRGDILLRALGDSTGHTVLYLGNNRIVGAENNWDGVRGDSSGAEVTERSYYAYKYNHILRWEGEPQKPVTPLPDALKRFTDLNPDAWYIAPIDEAVTHGWMNGTSDTTFSPDGTLTRAQAVCVVANASGEDLSKYLEPFSDVKAQPWYYDSLCWATDTGVVSGLGKFRPDDACTRAELVAMLWNWQGQPTVTTDADLSDVPEWARDAVSWAVANGIVGNGGAIRPNDPCSRAECSAIVSNLL